MEKYDFYCVKNKVKAKQEYRSVSWSGDKLACCSSCGESPWSGKAFAESHKKIIKAN